ncbi:MAG: membrane protein insertase YidC [Verrucomicrobiota bacterium]|jgi:YidC/Oxa1 family membrane protein insertase
MDRTGIIVVTICAILLGLCFYEQQKQAAQWQQQQRQFAATNHVATAQTATANANIVTPAPATAPAFSFDTNTPEQKIVLTNQRARYTFTSRGGGLKLVELLDYPETISARWKTRKGNPTNAVATLNTRAPVPVLAVLGDAGFVGDGNFTLTKTDDGVRAEKSFTNGLRIVKEFHLSSNYLVNASVRLENASDQPLALPAQELVVGTATPMGPDDNNYSIYEGAMWFDGASSHDTPYSWFSGAGFGCFRGSPRSEYIAGSNNVVWAAVHNQFFALIAMPTNRPAWQIVTRPVTLPMFPNVEPIPGAPLPQGVQTALVYPAQTLATNQTIERQIVFYTGPKEYRTLADIGAQFQNHADNVMGFGGFFGFCAKPLLLAMNGLHDVTRLGYGWVIVLITIIIRVVFWPLMAASTRSMKRMQALAPELKALQEKYKDDVQKLTQKQWELYRKHKVSPMSGCLPMAIQMPVFIGFFTMLRSAIELRGASFLWVKDLSKPDTLFMIPGTNFPFNLLPLLMGGAMVWQSHLTPPSPGMDPTQAKIMRYLPLIFLIFLYNYSAGLALYWTVNNLLSVLQTKMTKNLRDPVASAATPALTPPLKKKK